MGTKQIGTRGERGAREYLERRGYEHVQANYRSKFGEIDLVMRDGQTVVFVEVKAKTGDRFGPPQEMVSRWKIEQVKRMGTLWAREYGWEGALRLDVVGVVFAPDGTVVDVSHWESVG